MLLYIDVFYVRETVIVRPFQRNQDCYCDYFILIVFNQVRLRLGCPGSLMSLNGPTFHVTPVYLCIIFQCNLYISCNRGRVDDLSFFEYLSPFCFLSIKFHCTFSFSYKILPYFLYYYHIIISLLLYQVAISCFLFRLLSFPRDQSRDVTPRLGESG